MKVLINEDFSKKIDHKIVTDLYYESLNTNSKIDTRALSEVTLGVRGAVLKKNINELDLVIRLYRRGGLMKFFTKNTFIKPFFTSSYRPIEEFKVLNSLKDLKVPKVIAVAVKENNFTYSGIIVTEKIKNSFNFLNEKPSSKELIEKIAFKAGNLAKKITSKGVFHPDLHIGNVLYDNNQEVYIIDFDKASIISKGHSSVKNSIDKIISRWDRSVNKFYNEDSNENRKLYIDSFLKGIKK